MPDELVASPIEQSRGGQRVKAIQLYLNDNYEGGESYFLRADYSVAPKTGTMMVYSTTLADGTIDEQALMEEKAVSSGEKWTYTLSLRADEFTFIYAGS